MYHITSSILITPHPEEEDFWAWVETLRCGEHHNIPTRGCMRNFSCSSNVLLIIPCYAGKHEVIVLGSPVTGQHERERSTVF